jgi:predicted lipoprotein with Yx(FWY)xxD motif
MISIKKLAAGLVLVGAVVAGCSSSTSSQDVAGASSAPSVADTSAPASAPASVDASSPAAAGATLEAKNIGGKDILVAGSNGMTVYTFTQDTPNSGKSTCSGGCLTTWPALTVASGTVPAPGTGVTGTVGTITRDDGSIQVTYNGLPLYFYAGDVAPGDTNGNYPNWNLVTP